MSDLLERCAAVRGEVAALDAALLSGDDCRRLTEELARSEKVFAAARARVAARAAECGAHRGVGFGDAAEWLARATGTSVSQARAELATADAVGRCPRAEEALRDGTLSLAQAGEIANTEVEVPGSEAELVEVAAHSGLPALRDEARRRRMAAVDAEVLAARQHRVRSFRHWRDAEGMVRFTGALEPRHGVRLMNAIEAEAQRIRRRAGTKKSGEPFEAHAADAFVAVATAQAKRGGTEMVFVCDLAAYRRGHAHPGEPCHVVGGGPVPVAVIAEEVGDAFVKAVLHDGVRIETVAHFGRHIPAHLRTALDLGAPPCFEGKVCTEDGCRRTWRLENDHIDPVANGGLTSEDNVKPKCKPCHKEKTERDRAAGLLGNGSRGGGEPSGRSGGHDPP